ncbi:MAG: sigma factor-like helix-turn-helix DNA-binding protein, partial [Candidatus Bathyarchaeia archaeon]
GLSGHIQAKALKILNEAKRKHISAGKDPMGLAAAALYIAAYLAGEKRTQKEIADAAGVTEVTVRNRYKTLKRQLRLEIPD